MLTRQGQRPRPTYPNWEAFRLTWSGSTHRRRFHGFPGRERQPTITAGRIPGAGARVGAGEGNRTLVLSLGSFFVSPVQVRRTIACSGLGKLANVRRTTRAGQSTGPVRSLSAPAVSNRDGAGEGSRTLVIGLGSQGNGRYTTPADQDGILAATDSGPTRPKQFSASGRRRSGLPSRQDPEAGGSGRSSSSQC